MRLALAVLLLPLVAAATEPAKAKKPRETIVITEGVEVNAKAPTPIQLVVPRSEQARKDVAKAGDHMSDALERSK